VINLARHHVIGGGRRLLSRHQSGGNFARQTTLVVGNFDTVDGLAGCSSRCVIESCRYSINRARSTYKTDDDDDDNDGRERRRRQRRRRTTKKKKKKGKKTNQFLTVSIQHSTSIWTI
jgi:hypothetical protein